MSRNLSYEILSIMTDYELHTIYELAEKTRCTELDVMKVFHRGNINYLFDLIVIPLGKGIRTSCYYHLNNMSMTLKYINES